MILQYILIDNKIELMFHKNSILKLFSASFAKELDPLLWEWAYISNPLGSPIVSLCYAGEQLVGHYAVIPFDLRYEGQSLSTCLSMTTMVDESYRKCGLFVEQAQRVYDRATDLGFKLVFGFPNVNSTPGFRKKLGWELDEADYIACVTMQQLTDSNMFVNSMSNDMLVKLNSDHELFMDWRLSKPLQIYRKYPHLITKQFSGSEDIVYMGAVSDRNDNSLKKFNILLDSSIDDLKEYSVFPYQFGYKALDNNFRGLKFKKDMLMSDVF